MLLFSVQWETIKGFKQGSGVVCFMLQNQATQACGSQLRDGVRWVQKYHLALGETFGSK